MEGPRHSNWARAGRSMKGSGSPRKGSGRAKAFQLAGARLGKEIDEKQWKLKEGQWELKATGWGEGGEIDERQWKLKERQWKGSEWQWEGL